MTGTLAQAIRADPKPAPAPDDQRTWRLFITSLVLIAAGVAIAADHI